MSATRPRTACGITLVLTALVALAGPPAGAQAPGAPTDREVVLWSSVKDSRNPALLQT